MDTLQCGIEKPTTLCEEVQLRCPRCGTEIENHGCPVCFFYIAKVQGIWQALPPDRIAYYSRFSKEYEKIRRAEGRGSDEDDFYLRLPYEDTTGANRTQWKIRARTYDCLRARFLASKTHLGGKKVLDLGAGNGWMSYRLARAGHSPFAVDLLVNGRDGLGAAEHYRSHLPEMFPRFQAEFNHLPFADAQFDVAIFNASLHYTEDCEASVREALRCVRSGGAVIVCDTPWYSRDESGRTMIAERRAGFLRRFGTASDAIASMEYLTDDRLQKLEEGLSIRWQIQIPSYGLKWATRPLFAKIHGRREPSRFRIYATWKAA